MYTQPLMFRKCSCSLQLQCLRHLVQDGMGLMLQVEKQGLKAAIFIPTAGSS